MGGKQNGTHTFTRVVIFPIRKYGAGTSRLRRFACPSASYEANRGASQNRSSGAYALLLLCSFAFLLPGGCNSLGKGGKLKPDEAARMSAEEKKARLLKQLERKFENPDAHFELGQLYQADGLWAQAEYYYHNTLSFDPVHRRAQAARVKVLLDGGDAAKAESLADEYKTQASSSAEKSLRLALAFQEQGLDEYALACYQQALHLAPDSAEINKQIGYYYLSKNDNVRAKDFLIRSFQLNPNQPGVAGELGRLGVVVEIPRRSEKRTR